MPNQPPQCARYRKRANGRKTIALTILAGTTLVVTYRYAVRPILVRNGMIIPLQHLPSALSQHFSNRRQRQRQRRDQRRPRGRGARGHVRLPSEEFDEDPLEWTDSDGPGHEGLLVRGRERDLEAGVVSAASARYSDYHDEYRDDDEDEQEDGAGAGDAAAHPGPVDGKVAGEAEAVDEETQMLRNMENEGLL